MSYLVLVDAARGMHSADEPKSVALALLTDQLDEWHEEVLGLRQVVDQGWAKIYQGSKTGHLGLVDERRGMNKWTEKKAVNVSFLIDDLDGWFAAVKARGLFPLRGTAVSDDEAGRYRAFVGYDPGGYCMEFDLFRAHPLNAALMPYLSAPAAK